MFAWVLLLWACPTLALQLSQSTTTSTTKTTITTTTRRSWLMNAGTAAAGVATAAVMRPSSAFSAAWTDSDSDDATTPGVVDAKVAAKEAVRVETSKGIAYMRAQLDAKDYGSLLEFTKTYDQTLRKGYMGRAKKLMSSSNSGDVLTSLTNAVTFDLIGINRSVRPGQVNPEQAAKYIQDLQDDVEKFLSLD